MRRSVGLALGLLSTAVLQTSCVTVNQHPPPCDGCRYEVPKTVPVASFKFTEQEPGFLFIRFLNDHPNNQSYVVLVLVGAERTTILHVVGPLKEEADYASFFTELNQGADLYRPGGYFCPKGEKCSVPSPRGAWRLKPRESPGPPPPDFGSITTTVSFSGSLATDAQAAATAANQTVSAAHQ